MTLAKHLLIALAVLVLSTWLCIGFQVRPHLCGHQVLEYNSEFAKMRGSRSVPIGTPSFPEKAQEIQNVMRY